MIHHYQNTVDYLAKDILVSKKALIKVRFYLNMQLNNTFRKYSYLKIRRKINIFLYNIFNYVHYFILNYIYSIDSLYFIRSLFNFI